MIFLRLKYLLVVVWMAFFSASSWAQPDRADVRRGNRAFAKGEFATAELEYRRALEKDSTSVPAHYNLSNARYRQQQYEQAESGLKAKMDSIIHPVQRADAFHNLGNMQLMQKKYAESIESYKDALRLRPHDMETKSNLAYAQKMLQNQEDQDQNEDQEDQDDQDQDEENNQDNQNRDQKEQEVPPKITPEAARQMLEAMQQKERETQEKVEKERAKAVQPPLRKNW